MASNPIHPLHPPLILYVDIKIEKSILRDMIISCLNVYAKILFFSSYRQVPQVMEQ